jgi:serine/threonine-protein kinase PknK
VLREEVPEIGILLLSAHTEVEHVIRLVATSQGIGYPLQGRIVAELLDAPERIPRGPGRSTRAASCHRALAGD